MSMTSTEDQASPERSPSPQDPPPRATDAWSRRIRLPVSLAAAGILTLYNVAFATHWGQVTGWVDGYWANFWLISYSDGYERRALLGSVIRFFFSDPISYVTVNVIGVTFATGVVASIYYLFFKRISDNRNWLLIFVVMVSGPATTVFYETVGDPMHVAFALVIVYAFVARRLGEKLSGIFALVTAILAVLTHEASVFLLLPGIYLIHSLSAGKPPRFMVLLPIMAVLVLGIVLLLNKQDATSDNFAMVASDSTLVHPADDALPSLSDLLLEQAAIHFSSPKGPFRMVLKLLAVLLWPTLVLLGAGHILKTKANFKIFLFLLLPSLPLYAIGEDWGRFVVQTLMMSILAFATVPRERKVEMATVIDKLSGLLFRLTRSLFSAAPAILLLLLVFHSYRHYRIKGLLTQDVLLAVTAWGAFVAYHLSSSRKRLTDK